MRISSQIIIVFLVSIIVLPSTILADTRGISVSPSEILEDFVTQWPMTADVRITNPSASYEWIEIIVESRSDDGVTVAPSRFPLSGGKTARVSITFGEPEGDKSIGVIRISASRNNPEGLNTGTGVEIPYVVSKDVLRAGDLRAAVGGLGISDKTADAIDALIWMTVIIGIVVILIGVTRRMSRKL